MPILIHLWVNPSVLKYIPLALIKDIIGMNAPMIQIKEEEYIVGNVTQTLITPIIT